jgi:cytochrome c oxidase cbb3-type subunit III
VSEEAPKHEKAPENGNALPWWHTQLDHDYDGIKESDSELPRWWLLTLGASVVFAGLYWFFYHSLAIGKLGTAALEDESAEYAAREAERLRASGAVLGPEALATLSKDPVTLAKGKETFTTICAVCHKDDGSGGIGPNLTDHYWLHGNKDSEIWTTVKDGVKDKGMAAWGTQLGAERTQAVAAYVISMRNKDINGKAPQGDLIP